MTLKKIQNYFLIALYDFFHNIVGNIKMNSMHYGKCHGECFNL